MSIDKFGHTSYGKRKLNLLTEIEQTDELHALHHYIHNTRAGHVYPEGYITKYEVEKQVQDNLDALKVFVNLKLEEIRLESRSIVQNYLRVLEKGQKKKQKTKSNDQ